MCGRSVTCSDMPLSWRHSSVTECEHASDVSGVAAVSDSTCCFHVHSVTNLQFARRVSLKMRAVVQLHAAAFAAGTTLAIYTTGIVRVLLLTLVAFIWYGYLPVAKLRDLN